MYYLRAVGQNKYGAGTDKWLKIRDVKKNKNGTYTMQVVIRGVDQYVDVDPSDNVRNLRFAKGYPSLMPVSIRTVLQNF